MFFFSKFVNAVFLFLFLLYTFFLETNPVRNILACHEYLVSIILSLFLSFNFLSFPLNLFFEPKYTDNTRYCILNPILMRFCLILNLFDLCWCKRCLLKVAKKFIGSFSHFCLIWVLVDRFVDFLQAQSTMNDDVRAWVVTANRLKCYNLWDKYTYPILTCIVKLSIILKEA